MGQLTCLSSEDCWDTRLAVRRPVRILKNRGSRRGRRRGERKWRGRKGRGRKGREGEKEREEWEEEVKGGGGRFARVAVRVVSIFV